MNLSPETRTDKPQSLSADDQYIVAIGASAGGLEAIHEFFDNMPSNSNLSFILIQHLSPDYKSLLVELVSKHTNMHVYEAKHDMKVDPNCVYVIPNDKLLTIKGNRLQLSNKQFDKAPNTAIDTFLYSLADQKKSRAIAIILSGTGTDGTKGIQSIQNNGGIVIVQDPSSAKFDGMPNSAIATGFTDLVLSPELIPGEIFNYIHENPPKTQLLSQSDELLLPEVFKLIEKHCQYDFSNYKVPTILRRISRRMIQLQIEKLDQYIEKLRASPEECKILGKEFLIGVTKFFRDQQAFQVIQDEVLPAIINAKEDNGILKVWVTACSTGEEAYSIAILINEYLQKIDKNLDVKIFATDLDGEAIEFASKGIYPEMNVSEIEDSLLEKYFIKTGNYVQVTPHLRKQIVFAKQNILKDPPFIKNDLVSCRNMLIYMNSIFQKKVLTTLQFSLNTGGFLFLGPSEIPNSIKDGFEEINSKWKIYRKTTGESKYQPERLPSAQLFRKTIAAKQNVVKEDSLAFELSIDFKSLLTEEYGYAAIYVNKALEVKEAVGDFKKYLSLPASISQLHLMKMVDSELAVLLSAAIRKSIRENTKVKVNHIKIPNREGTVNIFVKPTKVEDLILIAFSQDHEPTGKQVSDLTTNSSADSLSYISELEDELKETRANLQLAVESLETANEELQSSNEELLSANEELQSSNEELQSLNEELHTLNTEHQLRIKELVELNDDLNNYFRSTEIAQLFIDRNFRIRKFNPVAVDLINLIDSDIGRPIDHISNNIRNADVLSDIQTVSNTGKILEREVELNDGKLNLMRILPYETKEKKIDGVVLSFVDITRVKELDNIIKGVFNSSLNIIMAFKAIRDEDNKIEDFKCIAANHATDKYLNRSNENMEGKSLKQYLPELGGDNLFGKYCQVVETGNPASDEIYLNTKSGNEVFQLMATQKKDGFVLTLTNITDRKRSEEELKRNYEELVNVKEHLRKLNQELEQKVLERTKELTIKNEELESVVQEFTFVTDFMPQMVWATQKDGYHDFYNKGWYDFTGLSYEETKDKGWSLVLHPDDFERTWKVWQESLDTGKTYDIEYRMRRYDGEYRWFLARAIPLKDKDGNILKWFGTCTDIHDQKMMSEVLENMVRERTEELQKANAELESSNTELLQFASVASHDLKEPLRKIHMFSNVIRDKYLKDAGPEARQYMDRVIKASARMTKLINDLLSFTRLSVSSHFEKIDLNIILDEVLSDLELAISDKKAQITVSDLPEVEIITGQMRQVFQNLISNSLKFSKKDVIPAISITGYLVDKLDFESIPTKNGKYIRITLTDNGIGFDNRYADKIFTIFQRLHARDKYDGTGIGLAITKKIIDKHNGIIRADSVENEGSSFVIIIPRKQEMELQQPVTLIQNS